MTAIDGMPARALVGMAYLLCCGFIALRLLRAVAGGRDLAPGLKMQVGTALACILFYSPFFVLGFVSLATGRGVVTTGHALAIAAPLAFAVALRFPAPGRAGLQGLAGAAGMLASSRVAAGTALVFLAAAVLSMFGHPQGFEVSAYHLPGAVEILRTGSLKAWDGNFPHTFPANASLYAAFLFGMLPEKMVSAANMVFLFPLVLATYTLGRLAGADRNASLLAACGLLSVPMIAFSSVELGADIGGIAFIVLAMSFVLSTGIDRGVALALAGACAGLALGFKSVHLISIGFLGLVVLATRPETGRAGARGWQGRLAGACTFAGAAALTSSFWLVRNGLAFDNPFYPVNLPLVGDLLGWARAGDVDFSQRHATQFEWVRSSLEWLAYPWIEWHVLGQNFKHSAGLGAFFAATVPVSLAVVAGSVLAARGRANRVHAILLLSVVFVVGTWWLLDDRQPRYVLAAIAYCMPLVAWVVSRTPAHWRRALDVVLGVAIGLMLCAFLFKELVLFGDKIVLSGHTTRARYYEYPQAVDQLPAGARILNLAGRAWHFPLAGAGLGNEVISMPEGRRLLGLPPSLRAPDAVRLDAAVLRGQRISHIFVAGARLSFDRCLVLEEQGRLDKNPVNGIALKSPRVVYLVRYPASDACGGRHRSGSM